MQRHYAHAPIVEAIIDIQCRFKEALPITSLEATAKEFAEQFPSVTPIQMLQVGVTGMNAQDGEWQSQIGGGQVGLRLSSTDSGRVLQLQQRGFTLSHMAPYSKWEEFVLEAQSYWAKFVEVCSPEAATRSAVRFINKINVPGQSIELRDFFHLYPQIPEGIPQDVNGMLLQLQMPQQDLGREVMAVINMGLGEPDRPNHIAVMLDFDIFAVSEIEPKSDQLWVRLEQFRTRKNQLFEACINDKVRELIA